MKTPLEIISENIRLLQSGHVKEGLQEVTKEQIDFGILLLQIVAAEIEAEQ